MTKKILAAIIAFFVCNAHAATYLDTENRLWFSADVVKNAIVDHVPDKKQQTVADLYQDLMEQETGKISIDSLFKVCRKAGFNTYKYDGFTQCRAFIEQMLTDAEIAQNVDLNGFCPGLDEKGKNPNKLRSITDKTRIGDFCSSTNIYMGEVIFKPGYNCSCMAAVCNPGFEFQRGACVTKVADGNGNCLREAHKKTSENNYLEKCKSFCEKRYAGKACKYTSVVMSHSTGQCICNPNSNEVDAAYESMHRAEERQINNLKYYAVCGNHKGKSGGTEVCVEGVFNWVNVGRVQAAGLAQEYARVHYKDTIHCDMVNTELRGNDDFVKCASKKSKRYYEFEFDDIKESIDADIQWGVVKGICKIYNAESIQNKCLKSCTSEMSNTARTFGLTAKTDNGYCVFSGVSMTAEEAKSKLAKIDGIDNYVFYHGIQIQGSPNVVTQLRQYIKSTGKTIRTFDCIKNVGEIKNSIFVGDDDVMRCTLNGQPIDFVFDDFSEAWVYVQEVGESKIQCVVSGGKFSGQECYGLTQQQCIDTNAKFLKQNPGASGFRWDGKECVSIDANEAQFYDGVIQIGTGLVAVVDCVVGTKLGCVMVMVESAGLAIEMTTGAAIENRAGDFLAVSTRCHARNCAVNTIKNAGEVLSVMGALDATSLNSVDKEFARLVGYLEPEDLSGVSDGDWSEIVTQLGGDPNDSSGTALVTLNKIGLGLQFASIGISGLRLTAQAITKLAGKGSRIGRASTAVARALDTSGDAGRAANNASDAGRAANNATDAGRAANNASDAGHTTNNATDVLHADIDTYRNATNKNRVRAKYHPDSVPSTIQDKAHEIFIQMDNIDNMSEDELRALSRLMNEFDAEVTAKAAEEAAAKAAADAVRTTNVATDGARTTNAATDASRTTNTATDAAHAGNYTSDAGRATASGARTLTKAEKIEQARRTGNLGYHGTDADIAMDDMIRSSANTSGRLGDIGYGIAQDYSAAEKYAVKRLIERQNVGKKISFHMDSNGNLVVQPTEPLNLSNKTGYVYTTAKRADMTWNTLNNNYVGSFKAAQMPESVEILEKTSFNIDDLIRRGKVKIVHDPHASDAGRATNATADAARAQTSVSDAVRHGSINISKADDDLIQSAIAKKRAGTLTKKEHAQAIRTMNKYFDENAARQFAQQMREDLINVFILHQDEALDLLDNLDGKKYAEFIIKHLGPKYGVSGLRVDMRPLPSGYAMYADRVLYINSGLGDLEQDELINLVTHEFAHAIDDLSPQNGVIGKTLNKYGDLDALYAGPGELIDGGQDMYELIPTERSAHLVGDIVSGASNYGRNVTNSIRTEIAARLSDY